MERQKKAGEEELGHSERRWASHLDCDTIHLLASLVGRAHTLA
jgi:hypothetical protein